MSSDGTYMGNPLLKGEYVQQEFTKEQLAEYIKCSEDPVYFIGNYVKVVTIDARMTEAIGIANILSNDCSRSKRLSYSRPGRVGRRIVVTGIFTL